MSEEIGAGTGANLNVYLGGGGGASLGREWEAIPEMIGLTPGPLLENNFNYVFNSTLSLQQNRYFFQNFEPLPKTIKNFTQSGSLLLGSQWTHTPPPGAGSAYHQHQLCRKCSLEVAPGRFPPFGIREPRHPLGLCLSMYECMPNPTVASKYPQNFKDKGQFQPPYYDVQKVVESENEGPRKGTGPPCNMRALEQCLSALMRTHPVEVANVFTRAAANAVGVAKVGNDTGERFSKKVFIGGLPPDIDEDEITTSFRCFSPLVVDWPHKATGNSYFPPKGYAFLLFQEEASVQQLIDACIQDDNDNLYFTVSSPTVRDKPVQVRPWRLADADYVLDSSMPLDLRKTVFVGGVPRPLKAVELADIMDRLYGGVCYAGIDTDHQFKYPKGAARVVFSNQHSYFAAIATRFLRIQHGDIDKQVEVKPYVLDDQLCDECGGGQCGGKFTPFFCPSVTCLQYYCEHCWATIHSHPGREYHEPLVKEGPDKPRAQSFRQGFATFPL